MALRRELIVSPRHPAAARLKPHRVEVAVRDRLVVPHQLRAPRRRGVVLDVGAEAVEFPLGRQARHGRAVLDAGQSAEPIEQAAIELHALIERRVGRRREGDAECHEPGSIESGIDAHQVADRPHHQPRAHHQQYRERHFTDDQGSAHRRPDGRRAGCPVVQETATGSSGEVSQRRQAKDHGGDGRDEQREADDRPIEVDAGDARHALRIGGRQRADRGPGDREAEGGAQPQEHEPFGDELREQPPPAGTESRPHGDFSAASFGADHQQVGEIRARDEHTRPTETANG